MNGRGAGAASARREAVRLRRVPGHPDRLLQLERGAWVVSDRYALACEQVAASLPNAIGVAADMAAPADIAALVEREGRTLQRIGLSATQKPIADVARFLVGGRDEPCSIIDGGHRRALDLGLLLPHSPLEPVMSNEVWDELYEQLVGLIESHRTTLVFVNTRRSAERVARRLSERLGDAQVSSHHGSLSREKRGSKLRSDTRTNRDVPW